MVLMVSAQERLAAEVAALDKGKPVGASKAGKGARKVSATVQSTGTQTESEANPSEGPGSDINGSAVTASLQDSGGQTDSTVVALRVHSISMQTETDPVHLELSSLKTQLAECQSELDRSNSDMLLVQSEKLSAMQAVSLCQKQLRSLTQEVQMLRAEALITTSVIADRHYELQGFRQQCEHHALVIQRNEQQVADVTEQLQGQIDTCVQHLLQQAHRLQAALVLKAAELAATQQNNAEEPSASANHSAAAQQHIARFESLFSTLRHCTVNRTVAELPDASSSLVAVMTQLEEEVGQVAQALQAAHAAEVQQLR